MLATISGAFAAFLFTLGASILILGCARRNSRQDAVVGLGLLAVCIATLMLGILGEPMKGTYAPTLDWFLYQADVRLGLDSVSLARSVLSTPALHLGLVIVYQALPVAFALVYISERSRVLVYAELLASIAALGCYRLMPAVGPIFAFSGFPFVAPHASGWMMMDVSLPRNAFPSLHFGWSLLLLWNCRKRSTACFASTYLFAITLATTGLGVHYFIDLVAAVPFCAAVQFTAEKLFGKSEVEHDCRIKTGTGRLGSFVLNQ